MHRARLDRLEGRGTRTRLRGSDLTSDGAMEEMWGRFGRVEWKEEAEAAQERGGRSVVHQLPLNGRPRLTATDPSPNLLEIQLGLREPSLYGISNDIRYEMGYVVDEKPDHLSDLASKLPSRSHRADLNSHLNPPSSALPSAISPDRASASY